jgi:hypothetical protein
MMKIQYGKHFKKSYTIRNECIHTCQINLEVSIQGSLIGTG